MNTTPGIKELEENPSYEKVLTLSYNEIGRFVLREIIRPSLPMILIWIMLALSLFLSAWFWPGLVFPAGEPGPGLPGGKPGIMPGLAAGLLLLPLATVPLHEGTHLIPFLLAGARDIRIGADLRQGIIYVTAHRFVADRGLFAIVALTPFIFITISLILFILLFPPWWKWVLSMTLFVHTTMCSGDAAMLGFMYGFGKRKVCTWDDADLKEAYFYASADGGKENQ